MIFKRVGDSRPYPEHGYVPKQWAAIAPQQVRLDQLVTTKRTLDLDALRSRLATEGLGPLLTDTQLSHLAERRAALLAHVEERSTAQGEAVTFPW